MGSFAMMSCRVLVMFRRLDVVLCASVSHIVGNLSMSNFRAIHTARCSNILLRVVFVPRGSG
jgi:hypothetical protein